MHRTSIIIPAYNEEKRIGKTLEAYSNFFENRRKEGKIDYEIIVSINNTTDRTKEIVISYNKRNKRIRYIDLKIGGKGYAVIEAFKDSLKREHQTLGFVDADMATSPEEYWKMLVSLDRHPNFGGVIASRYVKGAKIIPKPSIRRKIAKWMFNAVVRAILLMSYRDTQCGCKIFRRGAIQRVLPLLTMSNWAFDVELLYSAKKKKIQIKEIPTSWTNRDYSTINFWQAGPWMVLGVIRLRLLNSPFKNIMRIYDKIMRHLKQ